MGWRGKPVVVCVRDCVLVREIVPERVPVCEPVARCDGDPVIVGLCDRDPDALGVPACEGDSVPLTELVALVLGEPVPLGDPVGVGVGATDGVADEDGVSEGDCVAVIEGVREFEGDTLWEAVRLGDPEPLREPDAVKLGVADGVARPLGELLRVPVGDGVRPWLGVCVNVGLPVAVGVRVGDAAQARLRATSSMPPNPPPSAEYAMPSAETTGVTGTPNPVTGIPPFEDTQSNQSRGTLLLHARMWKRDTVVLATNDGGSCKATNAGVDEMYWTANDVATRAEGCRGVDVEFKAVKSASETLTIPDVAGARGRYRLVST